MTQQDIATLKRNVDRRVRLTCIDGEVIDAKVLLVSDEDEDVIFDLLATTREDKYEKFDRQPACLLRFEHIAKVEDLPEHV